MKCHFCDGTGKLTLRNGWSDDAGFRRERCGICGGTGESSYRNREVEKQYAKVRERARQRQEGT